MKDLFTIGSLVVVSVMFKDSFSTEYYIVDITDPGYKPQLFHEHSGYGTALPGPGGEIFIQSEDPISIGSPYIMKYTPQND